MVVLLFNRWHRVVVVVDGVDEDERETFTADCIVNSSHILLRHYSECVVKNLHDYIMDSYLLLSYHTASQSVNPHTIRSVIQ